MIYDKLIHKSIPGFPGYYADKLGNIYSTRLRGFKKLKPSVHVGRGYRTVNLLNNTKVIHRLILITFVGPCPEGHECCHVDGDKTNNKLSNLYWGTPKQNAEDSKKLGLQAKGESQGLSKLTEKEVLAIRRSFSTGLYTHRELASMYHISRPQICDIINRKAWKHI